MSNPRRIQPGGGGRGFPTNNRSFFFQKKETKTIKLRKDCQRNSNRKNAELTNEKREMANAKPANPRTPQQQQRAEEEEEESEREGYDGGTTVPARNGGTRKQTSVKFRHVITPNVRGNVIVKTLLTSNPE